MQELESGVGGKCSAKQGDLACMLESGHEARGFERHVALVEAPEGLQYFEAKAEVVAVPTQGDPGYWQGYWWPDVMRALDKYQGSAIQKGFRYRPNPDKPEGLQYHASEQMGWRASTSSECKLRIYGLRKQAEDDYVWHPYGYTLKEIKDACEKYRGCELHGISRAEKAGENWYVEAGDIWATRPSYQGGRPYRPWGGNQSFVDNAVAFGYLAAKEPVDK